MSSRANSSLLSHRILPTQLALALSLSMTNDDDPEPAPAVSEPLAPSSVYDLEASDTETDDEVSITEPSASELGIAFDDLHDGEMAPAGDDGMHASELSSAGDDGMQESEMAPHADDNAQESEEAAQLDYRVISRVPEPSEEAGSTN